MILTASPKERVKVICLQYRLSYFQEQNFFLLPVMFPAFSITAVHILQFMPLTLLYPVCTFTSQTVMQKTCPFTSCKMTCKECPFISCSYRLDLNIQFRYLWPSAQILLLLDH